MLNKISRRFVKQILKNNENVLNYEEEVYVYGIELILSTLAIILSILVISIRYFDIKKAIIFFAFFIPLRCFAGGYHANTYKKCYIISIITYVILILFHQYTEEKIPIFFWIIISFVISGAIVFMAPVMYENYTVSLKKIQKNKKILNNIIIIQNMINVYLFFMNKMILSMFVLSMAVVLIYLLFAKLKRR